MTRFKITAPAPGTEGRHVGHMFVNGVATLDTGPEHDQNRQALAYFRQRGYGVAELDEQGQPIAAREQDPAEGPLVPTEAGNPESNPATGDEAFPPLPPKSANKGEWITAATRRGWTVEDADALTKDELVDAVTKYENERIAKLAAADRGQA